MRRRIESSIRTALVLYICSLPSCAPTDNVKQAEAEVDQFHQRWNEQYFTRIYNDAHIEFRNVQSAQKTIGQLQHNRNFYGNFKSGTQQSVKFSPQGPDKEITLDYQSVYDRGTASEVFTFRITKGKPLLRNYRMVPGSAAKPQTAEAKRK
ncbi:MAG TPA: hypothetical protein VJ719_14280 [Chthoniobacterales bacterium]|nr:hypothetical protein [Chthoniobacterales bacterium]